MAKKAKKFVPKPDFEHVLSLPERLAIFLRLLIGVGKADWDFCLDRLRQHGESEQDENRAYTLILLSKGKGRKKRKIDNPCDELKFVQECILKRFLSQVITHFARHGVQQGSSILTNAVQHAYHKHVYSVDMVNAYPTVFRSRVRANLEKPVTFALRQFGGLTFSEDETNHMVNALVDLLVYQDRLPQGPPTSPRIFAIVCMRLDRTLWGMANTASSTEQTFTYSAYADDLTMSSDQPINEEMREKMCDHIRKEGFLVHTDPKKNEYYSPQSGTVGMVTGLVLPGDGRMTMGPNKINQLRGRLHALNTTETWDEVLVGEVRGLLGYISQVYTNRVPSKLRKVVTTARTRLHSN